MSSDPNAGSAGIETARERVLLVTGGSRGIGAEVAKRAAASGYAIAINYHRDEAAAQRVRTAVEACGARCIIVAADVGDPAAVARLFAAVDAGLGPVTDLVNSAGVSGNRRPVADFDAAILRRLFDVNVIGTISCCTEAVRRMSTQTGGKGGAIVNVSSMAATIGGRAGSSDYAASKAAVDTFSIGLAKEVADQGIRVNSLRPGMTMTDMTVHLEEDPEHGARVAASIPMGRVARVEEIASPIIWLLSPAASFISGACVDASGGGFIIGERN